MSSPARAALAQALQAQNGFETKDGRFYFGSSGTVDPDELLSTLDGAGYAVVKMSEAELSQRDTTPCVCQHPRSAHGDGIVHTACCDYNPVVHPRYGEGKAACDCDAFTPAAEADR